MTSQELRNKYLEFFKTKNHAIIPSASLVPDTDASVLFTMAGMHPLVTYLLGQDHPKGKRLVNCQKCIRTGDIDEVGDETHATFFEMLGNWSMGDYFKKEAIEWSFEFLTGKDWLNIPMSRLAVSVFAGDSDAPKDEESAEIWLRLGMPKERIAYLPKEKNWWIAGSSGPCGPDTEMFYWIDDGTPPPDNFQETNDDPRWVEIWNNVFMQFEKLPDGQLVPLKQTNVDTGMGLERTLAVLTGKRGIYDTDVFKGMWDVLALSQEIMTNDEIKRARIILDHIRASVFIAGDGVVPTNKDRGYVLRRLLRRAMVMARLLNLKPHWMQALIGQVIEVYAPAYPELMKNSDKLFHVLLEEEKKFNTTLEKGLKEYEKQVEKHQQITGSDAFNLYQTFGFPWELTHELALMSGLNPNRQEFQDKFKEHQEQSRTHQSGEFKGGLANHSEKVVRLHTTTHLMQKALRQVLGEHVWQKGSNITEDRTRFDFTHPDKMTPEQVSQVEALVNQWIKLDLAVRREFMPLEEAQKLGAIGLFGEKYDEVVSVYTIYDAKTGEVVSREFCGGPHVEHTGLISGTYKIQKEEAVSAGVRRIKAVLI